MLRGLLLAASCIVLSSATAGPERVPVLVELFTSEGCSSCPPADRLLGLLDSQAIVLSEHVDYWDTLGWKDRFSSPAFTERQEAYVHHFGIDGPYTPQMVVDGAAQFNGSDSHQAEAEIKKAASRPRINISLARSDAGIRVETQGAPRDSDLWLALADASASTQVKNGEEQGARAEACGGGSESPQACLVETGRHIRQTGRFTGRKCRPEGCRIPAGSRPGSRARRGDAACARNVACTLFCVRWDMLQLVQMEASEARVPGRTRQAKGISHITEFARRSPAHSYSSADRIPDLPRSTF